MGLIRRAKTALRTLLQSLNDAPSKMVESSPGVSPQLTNAEFSLTANQVQRIIGAATTPRDALLIRLLAETGMRRSEVVQLLWEDIDSDQRRLVIRNGKGGKMRIVPMTSALCDAFDSHAPLIGRRGIIFDSRQSGRLSARQLNRIVARAGQKAGIRHPNPRYRHLTCHLFRHTFARLWKAQGGSIESLSKILGHSSVQTTWDVYGTESLADITRNYNLTIVKMLAQPKTLTNVDNHPIPKRRGK
jgi:integrase